MLKKRGLVTAGLWCCVSMLVWVRYTEAGPGKVTICHKADSVKYLQITVAARAVPAHLAHGDCVVDDGVPCTVDRCDAALGCVHAPDDSLCNDGNACTIDVCDPSPVSTGCVYTPVSCDDGDACTDDSCDPATGCRNTEIPTCGACCLPDDSCVEASAEECTTQGGEPQGAGTACATTLCCAPMRVPNTCDETADCCTDTAKCLNGECCILSESSGCNLDSDCCTEGQICEAGTCCAPMRVPNTCDNTGDCCTETAKCLNGECCILSESSGCNLDSDCCTEGQICEAGTCCAPMRVPNTCDNTGDCCTETAKCLNGECCILSESSGCNLDSDCCTEGHVCEAGTCCAPMRVPDTCDETADCCTETAKCLNGECCILTGDSGCNLDSDCCTEGQTCVAGACCRGFLGSCINDLDCCSGLVCSGGLCDRLIKP